MGGRKKRIPRRERHDPRFEETGTWLQNSSMKNREGKRENDCLGPGRMEITIYHLHT